MQKKNRMHVVLNENHITVINVRKSIVNVERFKLNE